MFATYQIKMTFHDIIYKILKKAMEQKDPLPTGDFLFNELKDELILSEFTFRFFLDDLETQGYIKLIKQNIIDWGEIQISQAGINYVNQYVPDEHTNVNYNNFWAFLEAQIIKNTDDLEIAKMGADNHLATQLEILERQKDLANRGKKNIWDFQEKQVAFARQEVYRIEKALKTRHTLAMATANKIGSINTIHNSQPITNEPPQIKNSAPEFYFDKDYQVMIDELLTLTIVQIDDFLEYRFSKVHMGTHMSGPNWLSMFRKNLLQRFPNRPDLSHAYTIIPSGKNPIQIECAYRWEKDKSTYLQKQFDKKFYAQKSSPKTETEKIPVTEKYNLGDYALMQVYLSISGEGETVTNTNKDKIAGVNSLHGKRFYETFNKYNNSITRTETVSKRSDKEKKVRFEKVIKLLSGHPKALKRAIDEQKVFISASQKTYE